ncbi:MAG: N-acetylmuramic acid 6-phosphate etherase, partial [Bacteroidetes bacterium]|nr:N-acetylmuramic acid 6-phosphate etherase [Bacteroidota bacterium]
MMSNKPSTEQDSNYDKLDEMSVRDLLININREDHSVPQTIAKIIPQIEALIAATVEKLKA